MVTDYQLSRRERMSAYLNSLKEEAKRINGDESVVFLAQDFLTLLTHKLAQRNLVLKVPDCSPNNGSQEDFHVMFFWDKDEHYLQCEVKNDESVEFFYRNHLTKEVWGEDFNMTDWKLYSRAVLDQLSLFVE